MHNDAVEGAGSLWAIDATGSSQCLLEGLTIPNGMDWWEESFCFVDGPRPEIRRYNVDGNGLSDSGHAIATPDTPDGFTMDSNGNIWLAVWGGGKVVCLDQDGRTLHTVTVPSPHTTSVCIVENTLFITSARFALDHDTLSLHPRAGDLFSTAVPTLGRPAFSDFFTR
jgi:sugar lactone lactonase YvrE